MVDQTPFSIKPRSELIRASRVPHGGGRENRGMIDFSVCLNPFPLPQAVLRAIREADPRSYPDSNGSVLQEKLAKIHHCSSEEILLANGISQAIFLTAFAFLERGDRVVIAAPSYGEYEKASRLMGGEIRFVDCFSPKRREVQTLKYGSGHCDPLTLLSSQIIKEKPKIVWICNPNNPTGDLIDSKGMEQIREACLRAPALLVVDEAYMNFTDPERQYNAEGENCITLHSMTKDFSIPGLRLGYLKAPEKLLTIIGAARPEWSLNAPALAAGEAALASLGEYRKQWEDLRQETVALASSLSSIGFQLLPPAANFLMVREREAAPPESNLSCCEEEFRPPGPGRKGLFSRMKEKGMVLRDCSSFRLPGWYRIGTNLPKYNRKLIEAFNGLDRGDKEGEKQWER